VYTTHLPFMLDMGRPDRFRIMVEDKQGGWRVTDNPAEADKSAKFPLHVALGFSLFQTLFIGPHNLVVEGTHDLWYLLEMSKLLSDEGKEGLHSEFAVTQSGGAQKVPYMCAFMAGQDLQVAALLDSDIEGEKAREELVKKWILKEQYIVGVKDVLSKDGVTIEDLFSREFYLDMVNKCYAEELNNEVRTQDLDAEKPILVQLDNLFEEKGTFFNKGRVARKLISELPKTDLKSLGTGVENFAHLFQLIRERTADWFPPA